MCEQYKVSYHIAGRKYNDPEGAMTTLIFSVKVSFHYNPDDYGNGYYMNIEGENEPFGNSYIDIRYDRDFHRAKKISYIASYFENRYDGKNGAWKLLGINIHEDESEEGGEQ